MIALTACVLRAVMTLTPGSACRLGVVFIMMPVAVISNAQPSHVYLLGPDALFVRVSATPTVTPARMDPVSPSKPMVSAASAFRQVSSKQASLAPPSKNAVRQT